MVQLGVIGYGYWGPIMVRALVEVPDVKLAVVSDVDAGKRELVERRYPGVRTTADYTDILNDPTIDAVAVITPAATHYDIAMAAQLHDVETEIVGLHERGNGATFPEREHVARGADCP